MSLGLGLGTADIFSSIDGTVSNLSADHQSKFVCLISSDEIDSGFLFSPQSAITLSLWICKDGLTKAADIKIFNIEQGFGRYSVFNRLNTRICAAIGGNIFLIDIKRQKNSNNVGLFFLEKDEDYEEHSLSSNNFGLQMFKILKLSASSLALVGCSKYIVAGLVSGEVNKLNWSGEILESCKSSEVHSVFRSREILSLWLNEINPRKGRVLAAFESSHNPTDSSTHNTETTEDTAEMDDSGSLAQTAPARVTDICWSNRSNILMVVYDDGSLSAVQIETGTFRRSGDY